MGMNLSPRRISAWFRGRNRQSTLMLHSLLVSAMVVASLRLHGVVCAPKEGSAELGSRRRTGDLSLGPRKQLGHPGEGALSVSCGTGCGDLGVWSSLRAVPLRPSRCSRAAGLGGARRSSEGGVSFAGGEPHWTATTQRWSLAHLALRSLRLADLRITTYSPLPLTTHSATGDPFVPSLTPPTGIVKGTKVGLWPAWGRAPIGLPFLYSRAYPKCFTTLFSYLNHTCHSATTPPPPSFFLLPRGTHDPVGLPGCVPMVVESRSHALEKWLEGLTYSPPFFTESTTLW